MHKTYFTEVAEYNLFAANIACSWLEKISNEHWNAPVASSFGNIQKTVLHIFFAENIWIERFNENENIVPLEKTFQGTKQEHIALWKKSSEELKNFITSFDKIKLNETFTFKRFNGEETSSKYYRAFAHVINHSTYHRGQLVLMLKQLGYGNFQSTDLITFYRK